MKRARQSQDSEREARERLSAEVTFGNFQPVLCVPLYPPSKVTEITDMHTERQPPLFCLHGVHMSGRAMQCGASRSRCSVAVP